MEAQMTFKLAIKNLKHIKFSSSHFFLSFNIAFYGIYRFSSSFCMKFANRKITGMLLSFAATTETRESGDKRIRMR